MRYIQKSIVPLQMHSDAHYRASSRKSPKGGAKIGFQKILGGDAFSTGLVLDELCSNRNQWRQKIAPGYYLFIVPCPKRPV